MIQSSFFCCKAVFFSVLWNMVLVSSSLDILFVNAVTTFPKIEEALELPCTSGYPRRFNSFMVSCTDGGNASTGGGAPAAVLACPANFTNLYMLGSGMGRWSVL